MTPRQLFLIVFIEGFCSLGAEVLALRQLIPHVGSSIVVTAPTIGFFLLALALGYASGGRIAADFSRVVARNFLISAFLAAVGLAGNTVDAIFAHLPPPVFAYAVFIGGVLCPLAWLLGQTVPALTNLMRHERAGEKAGFALYWSTLGSFLGSVSLSLVVMQWLGVSAAVVLVALLLFAGVVLLQGMRPRALALVAAGVAATFAANQRLWVVGETAYASYAVEPVKLAEAVDARAFKVNNSVSSLIDESSPPLYARYIRRMRQILLDELAFSGREVLVLGAGGFTLSHDEPKNRYTYVDIDPAIRELAERHFLKGTANGEFVADDARRYVKATERRFDAVVVDVYTARMSIPAHLVTREFWETSKRALKPDGVMLANLILDGRLATPYARNLLATIESVYGRCGVDVLHRGQAASNVVVACYNGPAPARAAIYRDEHNPADTDVIRAH
ncbi:fused MFS/spermidine synthase [Azospira restricta]|uniref:Fused MFS/spermidine synthase n=1 Tax=Azospira restricta TaxID=404405 RepID=A0A974PWI3_9RHOO|nr:fused MFS/spermidine synthase [Azospira restricta]QRJ62626.1 fused MFS/spermidine synthase [Azospira restricta]